MVASDNPDLAHQAIEKLVEPKNLSTVGRYLDNPLNIQPRPYFWIEGN